MTAYELPAPGKSGAVYCKAFGTHVFCSGTACKSCAFRPPLPRGFEAGDLSSAEDLLSPSTGIRTSSPAAIGRSVIPVRGDMKARREHGAGE